jgi:hypothetical protein
MDDLSRKLENLTQKYDMTKFEENLKSAEENIEKINSDTVNEKFTT